MQPIDARNTYSHSFLLLLCYFKRSRSTTSAMWITSILSNNLPFQLKWIDLYSNLVSQHPDSTANLQNITFNLYNSFTCDVFFSFYFIHLTFFALDFFSIRCFFIWTNSNILHKHFKQIFQFLYAKLLDVQMCLNDISITDALTV